MASRQRRTSDRLGKRRHHRGFQGTCQASRIRRCTPPRLPTNPQIQALSTRLYRLFAMGPMSPHQRLHFSMREHTLQTASQRVIHRTRALQVPTAVQSLRLVDMAQDRCTFLNLLRPLKPQPGQETCKCLAEYACMEDLMLRTDQGPNVTSLQCASSLSPPVRAVLANVIAASSTPHPLSSYLSGISIPNRPPTLPSFAGRSI